MVRAALQSGLERVGQELEEGLELVLGPVLEPRVMREVGREFRFQVFRFSISLPFLNQAKPYWRGRRVGSYRNHARYVRGCPLNSKTQGGVFQGAWPTSTKRLMQLKLRR